MRHLVHLAAVVVLAAGAACNGSTKPTSCTYTVSPAQATIAASGGSAAIGVTAPSGCQWTADISPASSWMTASGTTGAGNGTVTVTATANNSTDSRSVQVTAHGTSGAATAGVRQDGLTPGNCGADSYQISPTSRSIGAAGGSFTVQLTSAVNCAWTTTSDAWITVFNPGPNDLAAAGLTGTGTISLGIGVAANTGAATRTGTAVIAGRTLTVIQDGTTTPPCSYTLATGTLNFSAAGGAGGVTVTTGSSCGWFVDVTNSSEDFVKVSSTAMIGSGTRSFTVLPNRTMTALSGRLNVYASTNPNAPFGQVTVNQAGAGCLYSVTPDSASFAATGGLGSFRVTTTPADCSWTASITGALFITITGGGSGAGAGTVTYQVNANTGAARSGGITIAGLSGLNPPAVHNISQAGTSLAGRD